MSLWPNINRFNAGEWSPKLDGRWDLDDYSAALRKCDGFIPLKYGPAERTTGTEYVAETKDSTKSSRLVRFRFDSTTNYIMEFGQLYIRWYEGGDTPSQLSAGTPSAWATTTAYVIGDLVEESGTNYYCLEAHTSGTFATDLAANKWYTLTGSIYEIPTTYTAPDVFDLQFVQINDIVYIVHKDYPVRKLSRVGATNWQIADVEWDFPPLLDPNATTDTLTYTGTTTVGASGTLANSNTLFAGTSDDVGRYYAITHTREAQKIVFDDAGGAGVADDGLDADISEGAHAVPVKGAWSLVTAGVWDGELTISKREVGTTPWFEVWTGTSRYTSSGGANFAISGTEDLENYEYTVWFQHDTTAPADASVNFNVDSVDITGVVKITTHSTTSSATAEVIVALEASSSTVATKLWTEGAFSAVRGYPSAVTFFETRLIFGGTDYRKQQIWLSQTDNFEHFGVSTPDILATDSITYQLSAVEQNRIKWIRAQKFLLIGTEGEEYSLRGADGNALSPTTQPLATIESTEGSKGIRPTIVGDSLLFWSRDGRKLHELLFTISDDGFGTSDLTKLAEHITDPTVVQSAYTQDPYRILWSVRSNGTLLGLVYNRLDEVIAWFTRNTLGTFESVESIYGDPEDEVWFVVNRTINGATVRYVERFSFRQTAKEDMRYSDCGTVYSGVSTTTIGGLTHLEGEEVVVLADGNVETNKTVSSGQITLDNASTKAAVGLAYDSEIETTKIDAPAGDGVSRGKPKRSTHVVIGFDNTLGGEVGTRWNEPSGEEKEQLNEITFRDTADVMDSSPDLFSGEKIWELPAGHQKNPRIVYKQTQPLPSTVLYTIPQITPKGQ